VYVYDRQLTEVTGLSRIGSGLIDDKKGSSTEPSVYEYSFSVILLAFLLITANTFDIISPLTELAFCALVDDHLGSVQMSRA